MAESPGGVGIVTLAVGLVMLAVFGPAGLGVMAAFAVGMRAGMPAG
jgi:hypothetical protein